MGFCLFGFFFPSVAEIFVAPRGPKTGMCQRISEQVKDFSWGDEEIRKKSVVKYRKEN